VNVARRKLVVGRVRFVRYQQELARLGAMLRCWLGWNAGTMKRTRNAARG